MRTGAAILRPVADPAGTRSRRPARDEERESRESERPVTLTGRHTATPTARPRRGGAEEETTTLEALREDITLSFEDSHMY